MSNNIFVQKSIEEVEATLTSAINRVKEKGWTIAPRMTINRADKHCCAIGAAIVMDEDKILSPNLMRAGFQLGMNPTQIDCFVLGFDQDKRTHEKMTAEQVTEPKWFKLGQKLRKL